MALSRFTGWGLTEIEALPTGRFLWWLEGVPTNGE
jgi:hypothetical protein